MFDLGWLIVGAAFYSLIEYVHHRHAGHLEWFGEKLYRSHQSHHRDPLEGGVSYAAKLRQRAPLVLLVSSAIAGLSVPLLGRSAGALLGGLLGAYLLCEWYHHRMHHRPPRTAIGAWLRRYHYVHHFVDPGANFGFTVPLWDFVFGTARIESAVRVPRHQVPAALESVQGIELKGRAVADRDRDRDRNREEPGALRAPGS